MVEGFDVEVKSWVESILVIFREHEIWALGGTNCLLKSSNVLSCEFAFGVKISREIFPSCESVGNGSRIIKRLGRKFWVSENNLPPWIVMSSASI